MDEPSIGDNLTALPGNDSTVWVEITTPVVAVAFAAFCVWLTVRIINRRERWARWTLVATVVALIAYPLSIGPVFWAFHQIGAPDWMWNFAHAFYDPARMGLYYCASEPVFQWFCEYSLMGSPPIEL